MYYYLRADWVIKGREKDRLQKGTGQNVLFLEKMTLSGAARKGRESLRFP